MKIFSIISSLFSTRSAPEASRPTPVPPPPPAPVAPRPATNNRPQAKQRARKAAPPPLPPAAKMPDPQIPAVGAHGETDLAPGHVNLEGATYPSNERSGDDADRAAIRELFAEIAAGQAAPVKTFIGDLRAGNATGEWLQVSRPLMAVLLESAASLGMNDVVGPMSEFISALDLAAESQDGDDKPIEGAGRGVILEAYESLARVFPEAFALGGPASRRDTMLLHALLKQVPGVGVVAFDAFYSVGLTSVDALSHAKSSDLSSVTGLQMSLCEAICGVLDAHRQELEHSAHLPADKRFSGRLGELLNALARQHDTLVRVDAETGVDEARAERKRAARRNRNLCALKIEATLIEMGEVDRADALRVLSFDRRIEYLEQFLGVQVAKRATEQR